MDKELPQTNDKKHNLKITRQNTRTGTSQRRQPSGQLAHGSCSPSLFWLPRCSVVKNLPPKQEKWV